MKRALVPAALLALSALALGACGGSGDEGAIAETIEKSATEPDPGNCTKLETRRFAEQNTQHQGKAAIEACEEEANAGDEQAKAVTVSDVSVNGSRATANAEFEGGSLNSQTLEFALVEEGGTWKLDRIEGFADYDGKALGEAFQRSYEENPQGLSAKQGDCIAREVGKASKVRAEELFFSGSPKAIVALAERCALPVVQQIH
jgi:hypothetical protein